MKYLFILDFTDGKVYRYNMKDMCQLLNLTDSHRVWSFPDDFEDFIVTEGFSLSNVEWMATNSGKLYTYMDTD
tara:strand:+ start:5623 stop:5841 length:219 start_codon:yes stop_codon:yes gene_type:complete